jgi:glutamate synthase (NADPH/NADH) small chain
MPARDREIAMWKLRDMISPFYAWKRAFEKPFTIRKPLVERDGPPLYRGFHTNDLGKCIGCGSCEEICQNAAIDMRRAEGIEPAHGDSGLRPAIDYGRCCWCALCVDICPTASLGMSNKYNWISDTGEDWAFTPGVDDGGWNEDELGYTRAECAWLLDPAGQKMPVVGADERRKNFEEMALGYGGDSAMKEAVRCLDCGLCVEACPTHMDVPAYIRAIRDGDLDEGLRLLYDTNPFSESCGRICTAKCQDACALGHLGEPIMIRWLKRYITDNTLDSRYEVLGIEKRARRTGRKIAVVGAGPSGLTAAFYLARFGHAVTVFERSEKPGGMLRTGIPDYRLPADVLQREIDVILDSGVELRCGVDIGKDTTVSKLRQEYDAVYISVGAQEGSSMPIEGIDLPRVLVGVDLLARIAAGERPSLGESVAVIGGGNTAMDVCRSAVRLGADKVTVLYRRTEKEMPANAEEIEEAREEGVEFEFLVSPVKITEKGDKLDVECQRMRLGEPDDSGRRRPVPIDGSEFTVTVDTCVMAVGQQVEGSFATATGVKVTRWNTFHVDGDTLVTDTEGVFAGGDCETGPDDAIRAIASGKKAAWFINEYLGRDG